MAPAAARARNKDAEGFAMAESAASRIIAVTDLEWKLHETLPASGKRRYGLTRNRAPRGAEPLRAGRNSSDASSRRRRVPYVIEGAIADESGTVSAGNMGYRPNGCAQR
jgi:hypothetical protein